MILPRKKSSFELDRANQEFLKRHREYFEEWREAITSRKAKERLKRFAADRSEAEKQAMRDYLRRRPKKKPPESSDGLTAS